MSLNRKERKKRKKKIKKVLEEIFIDDFSNEYTKTSFSKAFIEAVVIKEFPSALWQKDIYPIFLNGRNKLYKSYNGHEGYSKFINIDILDEREECEKKYERLMSEMCENRELPVFLDRDVKEYRIIYDLYIFEQVFGDILVSEVKCVKKRISMMAKTGAKLPSGKDSRDLLRTTLSPLREIEFKESKSTEVLKNAHY